MNPSTRRSYSPAGAGPMPGVVCHWEIEDVGAVSRSCCLSLACSRRNCAMTLTYRAENCQENKVSIWGLRKPAGGGTRAMPSHAISEGPGFFLERCDLLRRHRQESIVAMMCGSLRTQGLGALLHEIIDPAAEVCKQLLLLPAVFDDFVLDACAFCRGYGPFRRLFRPLSHGLLRSARTPSSPSAKGVENR